MLVEERQGLAKELFKECLTTLEAKGMAYAGGKDVLNNFKRNGEHLGLTKYQILSVYKNKHVDTINNAIATNPISPQDETESLYGRIIDNINYLVILAAMLKEDNLL